VAADASAPRETHILRGVLFIVSATLLFVCMNTSVKLLSASLSPVQLLWSRNLGHSIFIMALFAPHFGWRLVLTRKPAIQLTRSLMLLTSSSFFFFAIGHVPLADATSVGFTAPFIVALLAGPALGERVGLGHWLAIAAGFCGALIVIRPTGGGTNVQLIWAAALGYLVFGDVPSVWTWLGAVIIIASGLSIAWRGGRRL
jgi:drug/metabolite transporter (DMT)-like permease